MYLDLARELKLEPEGGVNTNCNWCSRNDPQRLGKEVRSVGNWRTNGGHPNYRIIKIGQNTEKSLGDLRRLVVIQTPVKDHQLTQVWKASKE